MVDLKTLSEMPSVKEMMLRMSKNPRRDNVSTTVTAVGSPLTDPEGVKKGHYSYSETGGIPDGMTQEEYDKAMKEFMKFSEMTPEQIEEMLDTMSKTTSPIKESNPMTRREELETKGISQLMAERFAKGVPRGAYSSSSFEKAGGSALVPNGSDFLGEFKDTTRVFTNPNDPTEKYHEVMEPGNIGPGFSSTPLPFYSVAWQAIMNRFANEIPPEVLAKIDAAYGEELVKAKAYENKLRQGLGSDFDEFDQMAVNSKMDKAHTTRWKALEDAKEEQQQRSYSEGKAKAEKILDKKNKKAEKPGTDMEDLIFPSLTPKEEQELTRLGEEQEKYADPNFDSEDYREWVKTQGNNEY